MTHDLSQYDNFCGVLTDAEIARLAGIHVNTVAAWRARLGCDNATTLGENSRAFQLRMPLSLMTLIREANVARMEQGRRSNLSAIIRDAIRAGLPLLEA